MENSAKEPYKRDNILQKRPIILRSNSARQDMAHTEWMQFVGYRYAEKELEDSEYPTMRD